MKAESISILAEDLDTGITYSFIIPVSDAKKIRANYTGEILTFEYGFFFPNLKENIISVRYKSGGGTASLNLKDFLQQLEDKMSIADQ